MEWIKRLAKFYFSKFGTSFKYFFILGTLLFGLLVWFAFVSNIQSTLNEYVPSEIISEELNIETLDCSGKWANSPLCLERSQALLALKESTSLKQALLDLNIESWDQKTFDLALDETAKGDSFFREEFFGESLAKYSEVINIYKELIIRSDELTKKYIDEGFSYLKEEKSILSIKSFEQALNIDKKNPLANQGLSRAKVLDEVMVLLNESKIQLKIGKLEIANEKISEALTKDPENNKVKNFNQEIKALVREKIIQDNLSEAFDALKEGNFNSAQSIFSSVLKIDPSSISALSGIEISREGIRENQIQDLQKNASQSELKGNWKRAINNYEKIISIDKNLDFALKGKKFANSVILFEEELDRQLSKPKRLASKEVFNEANQLLESSYLFKETGDRIQNKIIKLKELLDKYNFKYTLTILSDKKTNVKILRRKDLGKFNSIDVSLTPGEYTLIGKRKGFTTVRQSIQFKEDSQIKIICEQKI